MNVKDLKKIYGDFTFTKLAEYLEVNPNIFSAWERNGGRIPQKYHRRIIEFNEMTIDDLIDFLQAKK